MWFRPLLVTTALCLSAETSAAQDEAFPVLFTNVNIFDGARTDLIKNGSVLVQGDKVVEVAEVPLMAANAIVIDGGGRTLMPAPADPPGVIKVGEVADLVLVKGDPTEDSSLIADPEADFDLIMQEGKIQKNTLQ